GRAFNKKSRRNTKRGTQGIDDKYGSEADIFRQYAAKQRTQGEPQIVNAVKTAKDSAALVRTRHIDAGHLPSHNPGRSLRRRSRRPARELFRTRGCLRQLAPRCKPGPGPRSTPSGRLSGRGLGRLLEDRRIVQVPEP